MRCRAVLLITLVSALACEGRTRLDHTPGDAGNAGAGYIGAGAGDAGRGDGGGSAGSAAGLSAGSNVGGSTAGESSAVAGSTSTGGQSAGSVGTSTDLLECDPGKVLCKRTAPECVFGQVPRVVADCYGECVEVDRCACSTAAQCPQPDQYTCWSKRHCGPFVN